MAKVEVEQPKWSSLESGKEKKPSMRTAFSILSSPILYPMQATSRPPFLVLMIPQSSTMNLSTIHLLYTLNHVHPQPVPITSFILSTSQDQSFFPSTLDASYISTPSTSFSTLSQCSEHNFLPIQFNSFFSEILPADAADAPLDLSIITSSTKCDQTPQSSSR